MQNDNWYTIRVARLFDIDAVSVPNIQKALVERFADRIKRRSCGVMSC